MIEPGAIDTAGPSTHGSGTNGASRPLIPLVTGIILVALVLILPGTLAPLRFMDGSYVPGSGERGAVVTVEDIPIGSPLFDNHLESNFDIVQDDAYPARSGGQDEFRAMWCDGYKIVNRSQTLELLDFAQENHFNALSPLINGDNDGVFYNSNLYRKHFDVRPDFDPLMFLCTEAHKRGIEVHPWIHSLHNRLARNDHPDWAQESSGGSKSGSWINPARPEVKEHVVDMIMEIARYPVDGLKMDTIRYGSGSYSYDDYSNQAFTESGYPSRSDWQRDQVTEVVRMVREAVNGYKPYLWLSADVWLDYSSWYSWVYQDNREWTEKGLVDFLMVMGYTTSDSSFRSGIREYVQNKHGNLLYAGPYAFVPGNNAHGSVSSEQEGITHLMDQINIARDEGADGISVFKYDFLRTHPAYGEALRSGPFVIRRRAPVKTQIVPVEQTRWEFNNRSLREGWELYPRGNDYPLDGEWRVSKAVVGTEFTSPLLNIAPDDVTTLELKARNEGKYPVKVKVNWLKGVEMTVDPGAEQIIFNLPPDDEFHVFSQRLDTLPGWSQTASREKISDSNVSRITISVLSGGGPETNLTLDYFRLLDIPNCQKDWLFLGPFPNADYEHAYDNDHVEIGSKKAAFGNENLSLNPIPGSVTNGYEWFRFSANRDYVDLRESGFGFDSNAVYAFSYLLVHEEGRYRLLLGADDGMKVWINGELLLAETRTLDEAEPDEFILMVDLKKGLNTLLIKLAQCTDEFGFYARLTDSDYIPLELDDIFYSVLPDIPSPKPNDHIIGWTNDSSPLFRFDLVATDDPSPFFDIDRYWWSVDLEPARGINVTSGDLSRGFMEIEVDEQGDGVHVFRVCAVDYLGRCGPRGEHTFMTDNGPPSYDIPDPDVSIITVSEMTAGTTSITWSWNVTHMPLSGIAGTEILVGSAPGKGDIHRETCEGAVTKFTYSHITDEFELIYLTAVPWSGVLVEGSASTSTRGVIIDIVPPMEVTPRDYFMDFDEGGRNVREYLLSWDAATDPGKGTGIEHYILEYSSQNIVGWQMLDIVDASTEQYRFENPERSERYRFRITAVDKGGNQGPPSRELVIPNLEPVAVISLDHGNTKDTPAGEPMFVSANGSYDADGRTAGFFWNFGDGTHSYAPYAYHTYSSPDVYDLSLTVYDDFGNHNRTVIKVNVTLPWSDYSDAGNDSEGPGINGEKGNSSDYGRKVEEGTSPGDAAFLKMFRITPVSYILLATLLTFVLLFGAIYLSKNISERRESLKFSRIASPGAGGRGTYHAALMPTGRKRKPTVRKGKKLSRGRSKKRTGPSTGPKSSRKQPPGTTRKKGGKKRRKGEAVRPDGARRRS